MSDGTLLRVCDDVRDQRLAELGVRMEDKEDGTVVKIVGREAIMREREMERQVSGGYTMKDQVMFPCGFRPRRRG